MNNARSSHILIVDDDAQIRQLLKEFLNQKGYIVSTASAISQAKLILEQYQIDLVVLDLMLENEKGTALLSYLKNHSDKLSSHKIAVIMLSALGDVDDRINGLKQGADDYIAKPFEPDELILRMENLLNRKFINNMDNKDRGNFFTVGDYRFYLILRKLVHALDENKVMYLTETESNLLNYLIDNKEKNLSREDIQLALNYKNERYVDLCIARLRSKLEQDPKKPKHIHTVRGKGYIFYC